MKIQINSLEALERLIGGDTEVEIDIRNSIVQKFANRHLKGVVNGLVERGLIKAAETEIKKEVFETLNWNNVRLTDKYKSVLESEISIMIGKKIEALISSKLELNALEEQIDIKINRRLISILDTLTKGAIEEKAKQLIKEKLS